METKKTTAGAVPDSYLQLMYVKAKSRWAEWMYRQSLRLGKRSLMIAFAIVTGIFGACCVLLIISGGKLFYDHEPNRPDGIKTIRAPSATVDTEASPDTLAIKQIGAFHSYMDKLSMSAEGRRTRDSILKARPGLLDSIRIVESMYNNKKDE